MDDDTSIKLLCPVTQHVVSTGVDFGGNAEAIRDAEMRDNSFQCPACGAMHTWDKPAGETMAVVR